MIVTRDEIVRAANRIADRDCVLLTSAFDDHPRLYQYMTYLAGGGDVYDWNSGDIGRAQRLTFLAFMLAWWDDIAERDRA